MRVEFCDRCEKEISSHKMSWFNRENICLDCQEIEKEHPLYQRAKELENEEVKRGNYDYPGMFADKTWTEILEIKEFVDIFKPDKKID